MNTEERIIKEAEEYSKARYGESAPDDSPTAGWFEDGRDDYMTGATIEAARNKENAMEFLKWYDNSLWLHYEKDVYGNVKTEETKTRDQLYDLFEQNKKA